MPTKSNRIIVTVIGADTVGEGIESAKDLEALQTLGCNRGQGYDFNIATLSGHF